MRNHRTATDYVMYGLAFLVIALGGVGLYDVVHPLNVGAAGRLGGRSMGPIYNPWAGRTRVRVLVLGVDEREKDAGRSDTLMLVTLNPTTMQGAVLSFPRDMWVYIPGHGDDKINHAYNFGGAELSRETITELLAVPIDYYARMDFSGFKEIVDILGGVDINVEKRMRYNDNWGNLHIHLDPGLQHLDGEQAMGYVRYRNDSDYERIKRQQHFLQALMEQKVTARNVPRLLRLLPRLAEMVDTDMTQPELLGLVGLLRDIGAESVRGATVPVRDGSNGRIYRSYLIPDECNELLVSLDEHLDSGPPLPCKVEVRNGSGVEGVAADAASRLEAKEFAITLTDNWTESRVRTTQVRYKPGALHTAERVTRILGCGEVAAEDDSLEYYERNAPLRVILGADYKPVTPAAQTSEDAEVGQ